MQASAYEATIVAFARLHTRLNLHRRAIEHVLRYENVFETCSVSNVSIQKVF